MNLSIHSACCRLFATTLTILSSACTDANGDDEQDGASGGSGPSASGPSGSGGAGAEGVGGAGSEGSGGATGGSTSGGGSLPVGDCQNPSHTYNAFEQGLVDMEANTWQSVPNTHFLPVCAAVELRQHHGYEGCGAVIHSWSGGVWTGRQLLVWGGGHSAYHGNEVYGFDVATMTWSAQTQPSPVTTFDQDPQTDGSPVARHTYDQLAWVSHLGKMVGYGGAISTNGGNSHRTWLYDEQSKSWADGGSYASENVQTYWGATAYDPITRKVYVQDEKGVRIYDPDNRTWDKISDNGYFGYKHGFISPKSRIFFAFGVDVSNNGSVPRLFAMNVDTLNDVSDEWQTVLDGFDDPQGGGDVDLATNDIVIWSGGAPKSLDLETKTWTTLSSDGAPRVQGEGSEDNRWGTYGRFRYMPQYNAFILVNDEYTDVLFFKATPGCG